MRALLQGAIDGQDPVQRAASTPPSRLQQLQTQRSKTPDLEQSFNQMSIEMYDKTPYTVATSTFPLNQYNDNNNRSRNGRRLEPEIGDYPLRPVSAQSGFPSMQMPPGLNDFTPNADNTMNQVLNTLIASGNLSMTQIQQIESQLRGSPAQQWSDKRGFRDSATKREPNSTSPVRPKDGRKSPGTASESSPTRRSALLEEFRNNKTKKYELRVILLIGNCWQYCRIQW